MADRMNHPSMEEIMEFVDTNSAFSDCEDNEKYFSMVSHFVECEKCRDTKNKMLEFSKNLENMISKNVTLEDIEKCLGERLSEKSVEYSHGGSDWEY